MKTKGLPKQFLEVGGKPILIHTIDIFENSPEIDKIVVVMVSDWVEHTKQLVDKYNLKKVVSVVEGGTTGQLSIYNGLEEVNKFIDNPNDKNIVLIHDGVRPLINEEVIKANIDSVIKNGSAITTAPAKETVVLVDDNNKVTDVVDRNKSLIAKAPQSFILSEILEVDRDAVNKGITNAIDSSTLMGMYGKTLHTVTGPYENIKITTPDDFYMFKALFDARENAQIYGI
jgi:2-C-methyl-D-erythritol 4-phosphate cytidylyltransferase